MTAVASLITDLGTWPFDLHVSRCKPVNQVVAIAVVSYTVWSYVYTLSLAEMATELLCWSSTSVP